MNRILVTFLAETLHYATSNIFITCILNNIRK